MRFDALTVTGTLLVAGGLLYAALYFGVLNPQWVNAKLRGAGDQTRGAVQRVVPGEAVGVANSPECASQCRANLRAIEQAKRTIQSRRPSATGSFTWGDISGQLGRQPVCPCGGSYRIGTSEQLPSCTIGSSGQRDAQLSHSIRGY